MSRLTEVQKAVAQNLRNIRPAVIPGTNAIISDIERTKWYNKVVDTMQRMEIRGNKIKEFCDIAGVPD